MPTRLTSLPRMILCRFIAPIWPRSAKCRQPVWLAMHRPIWGIVDLPLGIVAGGNRTMMAAQEPNGLPRNVGLLLAGHIHTFEAINYENGVPPQIIAGEGGDLLDTAPRDLSGRSVGAAKIASGLSLPGYGFLLLTRGRPGGKSMSFRRTARTKRSACTSTGTWIATQANLHAAKRRSKFTTKSTKQELRVARLFSSCSLCSNRLHPRVKRNCLLELHHGARDTGHFIEPV